jgi:uncharacterized protein YndB with AHSA1/START domain
VNDTLTIKDGRNVLRLERRFAHAPEKVWRAVIEPQRLSAWYPGKVSELEAKVGGHMALDYGGGWTTTAVVTAVEPKEFVEYAAEGRVRWAFLSDPGGSRIELIQTGPNGAEPDPAEWRAHVEALVARVIECAA